MQRAQEKGVKSIGFSLISASIFRGDQTLEKVLEMGVDGVLAGAYEGLEEVHPLTTAEIPPLTTLQET